MIIEARSLRFKFAVAALFLTGVFFYRTIRAETSFQFISFADYYGGIEKTEDYDHLRSRLFFRPRLAVTDEVRNDEFVFSATLWAQAFSDEVMVDPWDILYEAYYLKKCSTFDFIAGQKLVSYGFADVYGPLNVMHSTNRVLYSLDDEFDTRRPDALLQLRLYPRDEDVVEISYVPLTRPDKERAGDVRLSHTGDTVVWNTDPYLYGNPQSFYFNYCHYGESFDIQFLYAFYTEQTPDFAVKNIEEGSPDKITIDYNKKQTFGAAYATRLGDTTFSQDLALNLTDDFSGKKIGYQDSDITINSQLLVNLPWNVLSQYSVVYAYFFNHDKFDKGDDPDSAEYLAEQFHEFHTQPYQHIAFAVGHFEKMFLRDRLKVQLNAGFFFSPEVYVAPRLSCNITDRFSWESGMDYTFGDPKDIELRRNPSDDNFYTRIIWRY